MKDYDATTYGERVADRYDDLYGRMDPTPAVETLASLAAGGRVLELGIGTGRIALPLAARGVDVAGIDASEAMVARLRAKPGGDAIPVTMGDFAEVAVDGTFAVVFVAFNTFFALPTQEEQVRCFRNVAARLAPGGVFVIDAFVPDMTRFAGGQALRLASVEVDRIVIEATTHDPVRQTLDAQIVTMAAAGTEMYPVHLRYAWPSELDLMAQLAGMRRRDRWGGWGRAAFGARSAAHVSVYEAAR